MLAARCPSAVQICRVKAATEVFPLVPVTAAMVCGWRG
jgi:predicted phosphoribosyltransferase